METSQIESRPIAERQIGAVSAMATGAPSKHGWLSALRSYLILDPLIWVYTIALGPLSLLSSFIDRGGRIQHGFARLWSRLIMMTIQSPVKGSAVATTTASTAEPARALPVCRPIP